MPMDMRAHPPPGPPPLCRRRPPPCMTTIPSLWRMGAGRRLWRMSRLIASLFWWQFVASVIWMLPTLVHCDVTIMSACNNLFFDLLMFPFDGAWGMCGEKSFNFFVLFFIAL
jgi:hypothetical protein